MEILRYYNNDTSILSELFRLEQLQQILLDVKTIYTNKFNTTLDTFKNKKISIFVSLWIMNQYNTIDIKDIIPDPLFPYNGRNNKQLEINLLNTRLVNNAEEATQLVQEWNLSERMTQACVATTKFLQSPEFQTAKHEYSIQIFEESISSVLFAKFKISTSYTKKFKYAKPHKFFIPILLYRKLVAKYGEFIPSTEECNLAIVKLLIRYYTLDSDNQQLAVMPQFYALLSSKYNIDIELFASGFNAHCHQFASLYYDIERQLGCIGYFHNYNIDANNTNGLFMIANPPFDEDIMLGMVKKFLDWLSLSVPISIVLTIPQWGDYATFETFDKLQSSKYLRKHWIIPKTNAQFYNYLKDKIVYPCNVYLLVLQNDAGLIKYPALTGDIEAIKKTIYT